MGQDSAHSSPLIRALAVRTMGCIRVDKITEYLCDPLKRALADEVPRFSLKTARSMCYRVCLPWIGSVRQENSGGVRG